MRHTAEESLPRPWSKTLSGAKSSTTLHFACAFQRLEEIDHVPAVRVTSAAEVVAAAAVPTHI